MSLLSSDEVLNHLSNIIHADTQQQEWQIDLTVSEIQRLTGTGSLDFGGSEFQAAESVSLKPEKKKPDDKYGWWQLKSGAYRALFNESISENENQTTIISLHSRAQQAGLMGNSRLIAPGESTDKIAISFIVPEGGCNIKENARIASLFMLEK